MTCFIGGSAGETFLRLSIYQEEFSHPSPAVTAHLTDPPPNSPSFTLLSHWVQSAGETFKAIYQYQEELATNH